MCPLCFASQFPLHQLAHGTGPQLRTVTNQHIKLHGYRCVCMTNHRGQQIVIPFYVCEVKQQILSVTRLVEQGFKLTLDDNPRLQHIKGFNSTLENTDTQHRTRTDWHDSTDHNAYTTRSCRHRKCRRLLAVQHKENLSEYTGNTGRHFSHHQEHSVQS